jgi:recombinational DNA repair ATPase RecF
MAEHAKTLIHKRRNFVESITPFATSIHSQIMADEKLEIRYIPNVMEMISLVNWKRIEL